MIGAVIRVFAVPGADVFQLLAAARSPLALGVCGVHARSGPRGRAPPEPRDSHALYVAVRHRRGSDRTRQERVDHIGPIPSSAAGCLVDGGPGRDRLHVPHLGFAVASHVRRARDDRPRRPRLLHWPTTALRPRRCSPAATRRRAAAASCPNAASASSSAPARSPSACSTSQRPSRSRASQQIRLDDPSAQPPSSVGRRGVGRRGVGLAGRRRGERFGVRPEVDAGAAAGR